ncbi:MFS transporter [Streptomyces sp. NBC_01306]|uniref:MFS transporter n=1 Tax=Streptomyces sp. NBC_01306 TaxID=2903819 RepID=UPI00224CAAD0|nr:MFS transporter [Streptomyces sp. NBC_01306]MCX4725601.1 MFS transporter [Streptomyces sp. NBC_01306]
MSHDAIRPAGPDTGTPDAPARDRPTEGGKQAMDGRGGAQGQGRRWRQLALLSAANSMDNTEQSVVSVMFPALRSALALPLSALSILMAVSKLVGVVTGPLWVLLAQRYSRKRVLALCSGLWGIWTITVGLAQNFSQLLILFTIAAGGFAGGGPLINGILADLFDDSARGRAAGYMYGLIALVTAVAGPLLGQLSQVEDGWRYGFFAAGASNIVLGVLVLRFFDDPGVGAAEPQLSELDDTALRARTRPLTLRRAGELLRIRSVVMVLVQRILNGQLVMMSFTVVFLVDVGGFSNAEASLVIPPAALAYFLGNVLGGYVTDRVRRRFPRTGRITVLQAATLAYAASAFLATQPAWSSLAVFAVFFGLMGVFQGFNPGINRPVLMAVTPPDLRSAAFALMLSAEAAGWALMTLLVGWLGEALGLRAALLWVGVVLVAVNGLLLTLLYRPYVRDVAAREADLARS